MFVDSHCHINFPDLVKDLPALLANMASSEVTHALCVSVNLPEFPSVLSVAEQYANIVASVGVHPDYEDTPEPSVEDLVRLAGHAKVVAVGETGLDYYRLTGDLDWQRERFRTHIRAARSCRKPLIIHTRSAAEDTLRIMQEEGAAEVGGVMHCFTESWDVAERALGMNFLISFSGIVTFRNALDLKDVARRVPLSKMLIETDAPYLAPVPHRGKTNQPAFVKHVAEEISLLKGIPLREVGEATSANFFELFKVARPNASRAE
jgi:TatD DNase family protein